MPRVRWVHWLFAGGLLWACGGSEERSDGADSGSSELPAPVDHRPDAGTCPSERPPTAGSDFPTGCKNDAECTSGLNGRCTSDYTVAAGVCSYDECFVDGDCGAGQVCLCRNEPNHGANTCVHGNCRLDADCGPGGYCSPSGLDIWPNCRHGIPAGSFGFFCHTAEDECRNDSDCKGDGGQPHCIFRVEDQRWACVYQVCTRG